MTANTEQWFAFTAYNSQALYGFGTQDEADRYCDLINSDREINVYAAEAIEDADRVAALESGDDQTGFAIADELQAAREATKTALITAAEKNGLYQYLVDGRPTGIEAELITAATDSSDVAATCFEFLGNYGDVTHDGDTIFVEIIA